MFRNQCSSGQCCNIQCVPRGLTEGSFDRRSVQAALENVSDYFSCHAENCDYGHIHDDEDNTNNIWRCRNPACSARICTIHKIPFHTDETCEQYDQRIKAEVRVQEEEAASRRTVADMSKACPNPDCGYSIHKYAGCDHITCLYARSIMSDGH